MSTILARETSTGRGSVALVREGAVLFHAAFASDRSHNSLLFAPLGEALALAVPDVIVVGSGPGSYSGVRVSLAAAVGISLAHRAPVVGLPSLGAFDAPERCLVCGDARRGSVFLATLVHGRLQGEPQLVSAAEAADALRAETGPAFTFDPTSPAGLPGIVRVEPDAAWLACRLAQLPPDEVRALTAATPEPLYLRAPYITTPRART